MNQFTIPFLLWMSVLCGQYCLLGLEYVHGQLPDVQQVPVALKFAMVSLHTILFLATQMKVQRCHLLMCFCISGVQTVLLALFVCLSTSLPMLFAHVVTVTALGLTLGNIVVLIRSVSTGSKFLRALHHRELMKWHEWSAVGLLVVLTSLLF
jgi:predicted neutral ceramidase superfamily lipid hydrolase